MKSLLQNIRTYMNAHPRLKKAQSFLELALILPVLLIMLLGVVEASFMISQYLDLLDLTREAARFASVRDPFDPVAADKDCSTQDLFDFYYDTSCIFSPPAGSSNCLEATYCNGLNAFIVMDPALDDVVVRVFSVSDAGGYSVKEAWPQSAPPNNNGYWAWSDNDLDTTNNANWMEDCQGNIVRTEPYYTTTTVSNRLNLNPTSTQMTTNKGLVSVELYYCYHQVLQLPVWTAFVSDPLRLHAYTIMSLPAAAPTPTPMPSP
ncbi:MAG: pilus assembly protein [Anaerolineaceae bacterium]|nr:pilus assembly protein [Anaerolineaceae bacterium]